MLPPDAPTGSRPPPPPRPPLLEIAGERAARGSLDRRRRRGGARHRRLPRASRSSAFQSSARRRGVPAGASSTTSPTTTPRPHAWRGCRASVREIVRRRERRWARDASAFLAVSDPVADLVAERWDVPRPTVLLNCPPAWHPEEPGPIESDRIREAAGIEPGRPIVLYQGGFSVDRGVEELVAAASASAARGARCGRRVHGLRPTRAARARGRRARAAPRPPAAGRPARRAHAVDRERGRLLRRTAAADAQPAHEPAEQALRVADGRRARDRERGQRAVPPRQRRAGRLLRRRRRSRPPSRPRARTSSRRRRPSVSPCGAHCRRVALERYTWEGNAGGLVEVYRRLAAQPVPRVAEAPA